MIWFLRNEWRNAALRARINIFKCLVIPSLSLGLNRNPIFSDSNLNVCEDVMVRARVSGWLVV